MAITIGALELYPAVETIGVTSKYVGLDPHRAAMEYRPSGGIWRNGIPLTQDTRLTIAQPTVAANPWVYEWRGVVFKTQPDSSYDVRVTYYDLTGNNLGYHEATVRTRNNNPPIGSDFKVVSLLGNDAGSGSEADPFRTLVKAHSVAGPGTTILMRGGTWMGERLNITKSGTFDNFITLMPFNNEPVIIDDMPSTIVNGYASVISLSNCSYVRIKGFTIQNALNNSIYVGGNSEITANAPGVGRGNIIEDMSFYDCARCVTNTGFHIWLRSGGGQDIIMQRNRLVQDKYVKTYAIYLWRPGWGVVLADSVFLSSNLLLQDSIGGGPENDFRWTNEYDVYRNSVTGNADDGYQVEGACRNLRYWENTVRGGMMGMATCPNLIGPTYTIRNLIFGYTNGAFKLGDSSYGHTYSYHNTIVGFEGYKQTNGGLDNFHSKNNIIDVNRYIMEHTDAAAVGMEMDNDLMYTTDPGRFVKWKGQTSTCSSLQLFRTNFGQEINGIWGQANFFDKASGDLRLLPGSLGINQGAIIPGFNDADSPWPAADGMPDIGAIESDGTAPPPTAEFIANPVSGPAPLTVNFINYSTGAIDVMLWDFGDGATSAETSPTHTFNTPNTTYTVNLTVTGPGGSNSFSVNVLVGAVVVSRTLTIGATNGGSTNPTPGQYAYPENQTIPVTAIPSAGYTFSEWQENGIMLNINNVIDIVMSTDRSIVAIFEAIPSFTININITGQGTTIPAAGTYTRYNGEILALTAVPASGWLFVHWEENGAVFSTEQSLNITITANRSLTAVFEAIVIPPAEHAVTITAGVGGNTDPLPGAYTIIAGESFTITAHAYSGYKFDHWEDEGTSFTFTDNPVSFPVNRNISILAVFVLEPPSLSGLWIGGGVVAGLMVLVSILSGRKK